MQDTLYLYFDGLERPVQLSGCADLTDNFPSIFPYRDYREGDADPSPLISIKHDSDGYHIDSSWKENKLTYIDRVDVLCDLIARLAVARSFTDLETLYLHAAAVVINGRAVIFPSIYRAGKSFLTACLVAQGHRYAGDDVVPLSLDSCKAHSAGFSPRLRLPLPATTDESSGNFIEHHTSLAGKRYAYLGLDDKLMVAQDESLDIGAFVLLEREEGITAQLETLPVATVFQQLIKQNFAREIDGVRILSTLTRAVSNAQCIKLRYDRADEAVKLLTAHFANWPEKSDRFQFEPEIDDVDSRSTAAVAADCFIRNQLVQKIRIEDEHFLASPDGKAIYHLNQIGSGIWELLAEPASKDEIISIFETAFPTIERSTIENDVNNILKRFQRKKLVLTAP